MGKKIFAIDFSDPNIFKPAQFADLGAILNLVLPILMSIIALIFLCMLIWGAFTILTAGGNAEQVKKGQQIFTYSVFGLIIIITSYLFVKILGTIFNLPLPF